MEVLSRVYSDHHALFLQCGGRGASRGPQPFHFEASWMAYVEYANIFMVAWANREIYTRSWMSSVPLVLLLIKMSL